MDTAPENTENTDQARTTLCRTLAPEDIMRGQHIAVLNVTNEYVDCCREGRQGPPEAFRLTFLVPEFTALRVLGVCLPFVLVEDAKEVASTLDTRRVKIALLDEHFAHRAMKKLRKPTLL